MKVLRIKEQGNFWISVNQQIFISENQEIKIAVEALQKKKQASHLRRGF